MLLACLSFLAVACALLTIPWGTARPAELDKPVAPSASATLPYAISTPEACRIDWLIYPTPASPSTFDQPAPAQPLAVPEEVQVLALLGTDRSSPFVGRTDAVLLVLYNPRLARASLVSLPSDWLVYIPGYTMQRLQVAYAVGGFDQFAMTMQYNLGLCIDHYAFVHLDDFVSFIDDLGGLEIDVLSGHPKACGGLVPGTMQMDGEMLLCYASYRIGEGETERNNRQQEVVRRLFQHIVQNGNLVYLPDWIDAYQNSIETDLHASDLLDAIPMALRLGDAQRMGFFTLKPDDMQTLQLPGDLPANVFQIDPAALQRLLSDAIQFVTLAEPYSDQVLTLEYALTISPTATITTTPSSTGTRTNTPTATLTPVRPPTRTRTPTASQVRSPTASRSPSPTSTPDHIAFSADQNVDGVMDLLTMRSDGSNIQILAQKTSPALVCAWNPNRSQILYENGEKLFTIQANGSQDLPLPGVPAGIQSQADWSLDGSWITFVNTYLQTDLFIIHPDGSGLRQVTDDGAVEKQPNWSPDTQQIVLVSERDGNPELYLLSLAELTSATPTPTPTPALLLERLTFTSGSEDAPRFSPDGYQLVYAYYDGVQWDIYIADLNDMSNPMRLTDDAAEDAMPSWSWDGSSILFVRDGQIWQMDTNGSNAHEIANNLNGEQRPLWMP